MPYNFAANSFHTKKLCSRLSSSEVHFLMKIGRFAFLRPPLGDLGATYNDHWKARSGLPISVNSTFFTRCYGWGATSDYLLKIGDFVQTVVGWPKISRRRVAPTNHSSSQKTRLNVLSYGIKIWTDLSTVLSRYTRVTDGQTDRQTDRWTDRRTEFSSQYRVCITCSAVKNETRLPSISSLAYNFIS